ncbi:hypothetical protein KSS87_018467 [Heliosperma pusillum]|nr:hypothetical protein KSS87_018467 [Heliosperma pusillum]
MQTVCNEARKTHCSHKELHCKQWVMKKETHCSHKDLQCKQWVMKQGGLIVHTRSYNANNG